MKCFWIFGHNWASWKEYNRGIWTIWIRRQCQDCGLVQVKAVDPSLIS